MFMWGPPLHGLPSSSAQLAAGACAGAWLSIWVWPGLATAAWPRQAGCMCSQRASCSAWAFPVTLLRPAAGGCSSLCGVGKEMAKPFRPSTEPSSHPQAASLCARSFRQQLISVLGKEMAQQVFNPPAPTPSQAAQTPAASPLAPAAGDAELDELHSQADRAIPSAQSAEQLGGSSGRKRKFTLQANPSLAGMAKGARGLGGGHAAGQPQPGRQSSSCKECSAGQAQPWEMRPGTLAVVWAWLHTAARHCTQRQGCLATATCRSSQELKAALLSCGADTAGHPQPGKCSQRQARL